MGSLGAASRYDDTWASQNGGCRQLREHKMAKMDRLFGDIAPLDVFFIVDCFCPSSGVAPTQPPSRPSASHLSAQDRRGGQRQPEAARQSWGRLGTFGARKTLHVGRCINVG
ncbi:hypothetical protein BKA66DRAFT_3953 [Pyrenochaeta sp. MPI-SDFR-AT-0127]|nr:hypothetical protein BKA66DRAFT_3953 [Pyrenochaeta sp. MPI-SDFR-AT-0127]